MNSKNLSVNARKHLLRIKSMPCIICGDGPPTSAHHIEQGLHFATLPLCWSCHQGPGGWHGDKSLWRVRKMDELKALDKVIEELMR